VGAAWDAVSGLLWVADTGNGVLRAVNVSSRAVATLGAFAPAYPLLAGAIRLGCRMAIKASERI
jgi:hypothetical protein